jgi:cytochrome c oxidase cbb3-type subunit 3
MHKDILNSIYGVEIFPIIALIIFFIVFISIIIWVMKLDKSRIEKMSLLPLEDGSFEKIDGDIENE